MKKELPILEVAVWIAIPMVSKVAMMIDIRRIFQREVTRHVARAEGCVIPESFRCVQCGICSFSCPIGIDVRRYALKGRPISDSYCLTCGECVARCPRGVLSFERTNLFDPCQEPDWKV